MRDQILKIIYDSIKYLDKPEIKDINEKTSLYGFDGELSSLELVMLLADIEISIHEKLGKDIIIADGRAMSQTNSPFRDVKNLADYLVIKLKR